MGASGRGKVREKETTLPPTCFFSLSAFFSFSKKGGDDTATPPFFTTEDPRTACESIE